MSSPPPEEHSTGLDAPVSRQIGLRRLLEPKSIAVVGANERLLSELAVPELLRSAAEVTLVSRSTPVLYGQQTVPSLSAMAGPADAVFIMTGADQAVAVAREAAMLGCGGVVVISGGFGETGPDGVSRQAELRLLAGASKLAVLGPNCLGFINATRAVYCSLIGSLPLRSGNVAVLAQSGYLLRAALNGGHERQLGFSHAVSSGNEADIGMLDLIPYAIEDEATDVICLILEQLPSWPALRAVAERARRAAKPIIALKLGRTPKAREAIRSHTGAVASAGWVYEVAFRQAGILTAADLDSLLDQAQLFAGLPRRRWRAASRVAVIANSGGTASLGADLCAEHGMQLPALEGILPWIQGKIGPQSLANPLDLTGQALSNAPLLEDVFRQFGAQPDVDAVLFCSGLAGHDERRANPLRAFATAAAGSQDTMFVATCAEASALADWVYPLLGGTDVGFARGVGSALRALEAMSGYLGFVALEAGAEPDAAAEPEPAAWRPPATTAAPGRAYRSGGSCLLRFSAGMDLLTAAGIPVAPYCLLDGDDPVQWQIPAELGSRVVLKLANVPHRTELGAVRADVALGDVPRHVRELRDLAGRLGLDPQVVCQPQQRGYAELFAGVKVGTEFGTVLILGQGGVAVEETGRLVGRILPLGQAQREELADEFGERTGLAAARGGVLWSRAELVNLIDALVACSEAAAGWLDSLDVNPLLISADGLVAVDVTCVIAPAPAPIPAKDS
jgi:acetate---CoA ligase (ADP-forming)